MTAGRYTSRIDQRFLSEVAPNAPGGQRVLLYDFVTARTDLLEGHREGIDRAILPWLSPSSRPTAVWIGGLASRRGGDGLNRGLAFGRAGAVEQYLTSRVRGIGSVSSPHSISTHYFGERFSTHHTENSPYYRSVLVVLSPLQDYRPPPRPEPPPRVRATNRFRILLSWGFDGGEGIAIGSYTFIIDYDLSPDAPPSDPVAYKLRGFGIGGGAPASASSGNPQTDWNRFTSNHLCSTRGFEGTARLGSAGVAAPGLGGITFMSYLRLNPAASPHNIVIDPLRTGTGAQLGAGVLEGPFRIDSASTQQFRGGR
ncbi:MAG: hypothetical protein RLO52_03490 [Sandaracinaceae bacterium]